jgi:hypothetical protein
VRQAAVLSGLGLCLALLLLAVRAPDAALSQLAVGSAPTPTPILLTVRKVRRSGRGDDTAQNATGNATRGTGRNTRPARRGAGREGGDVSGGPIG